MLFDSKFKKYFCFKNGTMKNKIADIRKDYKRASMSFEDLKSNPIDQFNIWFNNALRLDVMEVNAMVLSTISKDGIPSGRVVLLKNIDYVGFTFYTNYNSSKGIDMKFNPNVSATFFWPELEQQIRITGTVKRLDSESSDIYFNSRPKRSQIAASVSNQSSLIDDRSVLENEVYRLEKLYKNKDIPRPDHWGGYLLNPSKIEFWQGRESRLHDRCLYELHGNEWKMNRLAP
tara:strand:+ start:172 stop:864 length:693 start_codon:yes stop_codon:yes gene_type:complete